MMKNHLLHITCSVTLPEADCTILLKANAISRYKCECEHEHEHRCIHGHGCGKKIISRISYRTIINKARYKANENNLLKRESTKKVILDMK